MWIKRQLKRVLRPGLLRVRRMNLRPRIAVLTTYPPIRSGGAEYTARSLKSIARHAVVDVYTPTPQPRPDPWVKKFAPLDSIVANRHEYDLILPIIGNTPAHIDILRMHETIGGPCLIPDNRLCDLYAGCMGMERFAQMASASANRDVSIDECFWWLAEPWRLPAPFFDDVLNRTNLPIFHSRGTQEKVHQLYQRGSSCLPFCGDPPFAEQDLGENNRRFARERLGLRSDRLNLVTFGTLARRKGLLDCIWTVQMLRMWGVHADLHFVGQPGEMKGEMTGLVDQLRLNDHVHWLPTRASDETYRDFLLAADFGIQLRAHGVGGLSHSFQDCIGAGLTTVANDDLADAMNAPDYVLRVPDHLSPLLIAETIAKAVQDGRFRQRQTASRREYVERHSFDRYAVEFLRVTGLAG